MSLLFVDGFDHYATADIAKKWTSLGTVSPVINSTGGRRDSGRMTIGASRAAIKTFSNTASLVVGFAFRLEESVGTARRIAAFYDSSTIQAEIVLNTNNTFSVLRNGTAVTNGTSTEAISLNVYYYLEWKITIANSIASDSCVVRLNGSPIINVSAGQDLQATANAYANSFMLGSNSSSAPTCSYDDFYLCDQSGSTNNDFLGDCRVDTIYPDADGFYSDGTPSTGSDNYAMVDETPVSTTDYVTLSNVNDKDTYSFQPLDALAGQLVYGVQVNAAADKDDAGSRSAATFVRSGSTDDEGSGVGLSTTYTFVRDIYEEDPDTSAAWTQSGINSAEFGLKVTA